MVFLGDYVDRGPDARGVVERLMRGPGPGRPGETWVPLKGNHDHLFLEACADPWGHAAQLWARSGGRETMASYRIGEAGRRFPEAVPRSHLIFFERLAHVADDGERLYVHAGLRPGVPFSQQVEADLLWIRRDLLGREHGFDRTVVHGHTICADGPEIGHRRVGLDLGCFASGTLACARFDPGVAMPTVRVVGPRPAVQADLGMGPFPGPVPDPLEGAGLRGA